MATAPTQMSREVAMELLTASGTFVAAALTAFAAMDDATFEVCAMPAAALLMKKTRKPAAKQMSEEEKAERLLKMKMDWLEEISTSPMSVWKLVDKMGLAPTEPTIVYHTADEVSKMGVKEKNKKIKHFANNSKLINDDETDIEVYTAYSAEYNKIMRKVQRGAYNFMWNTYEKKKFSVGNVKINAAGNMVKAGGKSEVGENELDGKITIDGKSYDLQKNTDEAEKGFALKVPDGMKRLKKCGAESTQVAILPFTTPYHPTNNCGCSAPVMIKDITDFMVEDNGDGTFKKIGMEDAVRCAPCFRRCNASTHKGADGLCARHSKTAVKEHSARTLKVAETAGFSLGEKWTAGNTAWYEGY